MIIPGRHPREGGDPYGAMSAAGTGMSDAGSVMPKSRSMGPRLRGDDDGKSTTTDAAVARDFEALFIAQMLKAARAARLADDPLAPDDSAFRDAQDRDLAQRLATAAPLGVARLLA